MLHLQARVDLQEVRPPDVRVIDELDSPGGAIGYRARKCHGGRAQLLPHCRIEARGRCFLNHLLIAPLHGAIALTPIDHVPEAVAEDLHFDVASPLDKFLEKQSALLEVGLTQARDRIEGFPQLTRVAT